MELAENMLHNEENDEDTHDHTIEVVNLITEKQYLSALVLMAGLGVHSIMEGLALGGATDVNVAVTLGIAIVLHKYLAAFAIGVQLAKSESKFGFLFALLFGSFTPIGIGVGWILQNTFQNWVADVLVCLASGTFLYVAICEILVPEFSKEKEIETEYLKMGPLLKNNVKPSITNSPLLTSGSPIGTYSPSFISYAKSIGVDPLELQKQYLKEKQINDCIKLSCVLLGYGLMCILAIWV